MQTSLKSGKRGASVASKFQILSEEFIEFVRLFSGSRSERDGMHQAHAKVREALLLEDLVGDAWLSSESAWAAACSAKACRSGRDAYASWRSYFLDRRALNRMKAARAELQSGVKTSV